jgi:Tol biopolymer transport system component
VERVVGNCLAKDAGKRVQSARELRERLEALRERLKHSRLQPQRFRRTRRIAAWALPAAVLAVALLIFGMSGNRTPANRALRFQRLTDDPHVTTEPALSLDGRWLAYASDRAEDGNVDIWIQGTGQASARRLTNHPAVDHEPALSPDGRLLAFRSEREPAGIYVMSLKEAGGKSSSATVGQERLVATRGRRPQFSPDGQWIAYWSGPEVNGDAAAGMHSAIFVIPSAGGAPRRLAENFSEARYPVWSPDSGSVLFAGHREFNSDDSEFWTAPLDGGAQRLKARWKNDAWNSMTPATPFAWPRKDLLLLRWVPPGTNSLSTHIWRVRFPNRPESEAPVPEQVTSGLGPYTWCTADRSGRIMVAGGPRRSAIWSLPIVADTAELRGGMSPLALEGERESLSSMTADGKQMLFESQDPRGLERWILRNLDSGLETILESGSLTGPMLIAPGGKWVSTMKHPFLSQRLGLPPALKLRQFKNRQIMWDLSQDGSLCLSAGLSRHRSVELDRSATDDSVVLLEHPAFNLYLAYFSADGRWIVVTAENGQDPPRLFAVPFRPPYPIPVSSWVDLGEGIFGRWAPSGNRIYFLREHQGARCIFTRALDPVTKRPVGDATAVLHLHSAWRSPLQMDPGYFRLVVTPGRLVFPLGEIQSNLWLAE